MACNQTAFIWYELMTTDADAAGRFYNAVVGWNFSGQAPPEQSGGIDYRHIGRSDGGGAGGVLKLSDDMVAGGARPAWLGYLQSADVDATVAAIVAEGGKVLMPAFDMPVGRIAMVTDPQGTPVYVMKPIPPAGQPDAKSDVFDTDTPQHVRWNELMSADPDASVAFYRKHFGIVQEGEMPMGELGAYRFIQSNGEAIGAIMGLMPGAPGSVWTFYIGVDDIDRAAAAVRENGGEVIIEPMEIPGGEFSCNGVDPQGAYFGLVGPRKG
jgi:predicted enzyme related to lactoylglutathione lyase